MSNSTIALSVIILAKNEMERIAACIQSLPNGAQILVIDTGSTDTTVDIARSLGATVYSKKDVSDFSVLRMFGKEKATTEWLLYVDADETLSHELQQEILQMISQSDIEEPIAYELKRVNRYLHHPWPGQEYLLRLMKKDALVSWYGKLHESAEVSGQIGRLPGVMYHETHRTFEEMVAKTNVWSHTEAQLRFSAHHPPVVWWRIIRVMLTGFFDSFVRKNGWKAGIVGVMESVYQGFSLTITYLKLWELQKSQKGTSHI